MSVLRLLLAPALLLAALAPAAAAEGPGKLVPGRILLLSEIGPQRVGIDQVTGSVTLQIGMRPPPSRLRVFEAGAHATATALVEADGFAGFVILPADAGAVELEITAPESTPIEVLVVASSSRPPVRKVAGFPSMAVLEEIERRAPVSFPAYFDRFRLGSSLLPRRDPAPAFPECADLGKMDGMRRCSGRLLAGLESCLHETGKRGSSLRALAAYLDDARLAEALPLLEGSACSEVAGLVPSSRAQQAAAGILEAIFERYATASADQVGPASAGGGSLDAELSGILRASCAGKALLAALESDLGPGVERGLPLLVESLREEARDLAGEEVVVSGQGLLEAAQSLSALRSSGCEAHVALMALLDGWTARVARDEPAEHGRFIERFNDRRLRSANLPDALPDEFPLLFAAADRILSYLT